MQRITMTDELAKALTETGKPVELVNEAGILLGYFSPIGFTPAEIEEAQRRSREGKVWYSTEQVLERLRQLERDNP